MPTKFDEPRSVERAAVELAARVRAAAPVERGGFVRLETAVESCDILQWLRRVAPGARRYFRDRSARLEIAGLGSAIASPFGAHAALEQRGPQVETASASAWFVALPFDAARARDDGWRAFDDHACVLPEIELRREGESHVLAVNIAPGADRDLLARALAALETPCGRCVVEPALVREGDGTDEAEFSRAVRGALARIREGALRKIVLARTRRYAASGPLDGVAVLARLAARESRGFRFLVEAGEGRAFLGVTPERLVSRSGRVARSEAVAGTRPRGVDGVADRLLGESLLASAKDRREHELVVERVRDALASCATSVRVENEPRLLRLAYVQHLATRVQADVRAGVTDADLVAALHPTPAVAGAPVAAAIAALREFEPFDRGLYAGPVGVVSRDGAELAVAIRSARIDGDRLTAFAGAGIVDGSDPAEEWRETGHKLLAFERLAT
ncbi:MAG: isochorismate synthase MenF [Planctomycetota bacterium]